MIRKELHEGTIFIYRLYVVDTQNKNVYMKYLSNNNNLVTSLYLKLRTLQKNKVRNKEIQEE